jgi:hypothetical protein
MKSLMLNSTALSILHKVQTYDDSSLMLHFVLSSKFSFSLIFYHMNIIFVESFSISSLFFLSIYQTQRKERLYFR